MLKKHDKTGMVILNAMAVFLALYLTSLYNNLLFHSITGIFIVVIDASLFLLAWIARKRLQGSYWAIVGAAYLFIGVLNILYTLSYDGMQIFGDNNFYGSQIKIVLLYIESITLLASLLYMEKKIEFNLSISIYTVISAALILSIFYLKTFPVYFIDGQGVTLFYRAGEIIAFLILLSGVTILYKNKENFQQGIYKSLFTSYILNIISVVLLLSYVSSSIAEISGLYIKILSLCFMLHGIIEQGINKPYNAIYRELRLKEVQLEEISLVDEFTGVFNRRAAFKALEKMIKLVKRNRQSLSICYIGIDNYNEVVESYGEEEGDIMVNMFTSSLKESVRQSDYVCRLDNDEFLLILPECGTESGYVIVERVKESLAILNAEIDKPYIINFSYGFASYNYNNTFDIDSFLRIADFNMYQNRMNKDEIEETNILYYPDM